MSTRGRDLMGPVAFYTALGAWLLWPIVDHAARAFPVAGSPQLLADILLVAWTLAWECHALATDPFSLFSANRFHPHPQALALSEHLLGNLPVFAPVYAVTGNAVLGTNVTMLVSYVATGTAMYWLVRDWTGNTAAGLLAGCLLAFNPWRANHGMWWYHWLNFQYLPVILLALDRVARRPRAGIVVAAAAILSLQASCSYYLGYVAFFAAFTFATVHQLATPRAERRPLWLLLALIAAALALVPISLPYLAAFGHVEGLQLDTAGWRLVVWRWGHPLKITQAFISPGTIGLAAIGLVSLVRADRLWRARGLGVLAIALTGYVLCLGPGPAWLPFPLPFALAQMVVPGMGDIRMPWLFGILALLGLTALAGLGAAAILSLVKGRLRTIAGVGLVVLGIVSAWAAARQAHYGFRTVPTGRDVPPVYRWLATHGAGGPLLELPIYVKEGLGLRRMEANAWAMYFSTFHWLPLLNGYGRYDPPDQAPVLEAARRIPEPEAIPLLVRDAGLRWIVLHDKARHARLATGLARLATVRLVGEFGNDALYEITRSERRP